MKKNHLTIIFMKDTNQPHTMEVPVRIIILLGVLLIVFVFTYVYFIRGYRSLTLDNEDMETEIRSLKFKISKLESDISKLNRQDISSIRSMNLSGTAIVLKDSLPEKRDVAVRNLKLEANPIDGKLRFFFVLDNNTEDNSMIRGYVFVVLKNLENQRYYKSYPVAEFKDGRPLNYSLGDPYTIKRFKEYRGVLELEEEADILEIFIYSDIGELLFRIRHEL